MFYYEIINFKIENNKVFISKISEKNLIHIELQNILNDFEKYIYKTIEKRGLKNDFKYVLSLLSRRFIENDIIARNLLKKNIKCFLFTQHSSFVGNKIISTFCKYYSSSDGNYIITFDKNFGKFIKNSNSTHKTIINGFHKLLKNFNVKKDINITFIEIYGSSRLEFFRSNLGAKDFRYFLKK